MVTDGAVAPMQSLAMGSARAADVAGNSEHMDCKRVGPGGGALNDQGEGISVPAEHRQRPCVRWRIDSSSHIKKIF